MKNSKVFCADLILKNGKIRTVDDTCPEAEAVAIWRNRILAVGSNSDIENLTGSSTKVIDLEEKLVLPGFIDNHTHFLWGGLRLLEVQLRDTKNKEEFGEALVKKSTELPRGEWLTGGGWDHDCWKNGELPTAALIDRYVPNRPVFVLRFDLHMAAVNTLVLEMAGIDENTPDPVGGVIVRDNSGKPSGVLKDSAISLLNKFLPQHDRAKIKKALLKAFEEARTFGVTSAQEMNYDPLMFSVYQELLDENAMTARIDVRVPLKDWRNLADMGVTKNFCKNNFLKLGGLKAFVDGSVGSSTALFYEPYIGEPDNTGIYLATPDELKQDLLGAVKAGLHPAIHAIGDRANAELLDVYEAVIKELGPGDYRFRIEHAQHVREEHFARFGELGVLPCAQPYHAVDDARFIECRVGKERCKTTYAFRTFLDHNVKLSFGSDWTVAPLDPITGIDAAVTRRAIDGSTPDGWHSEQKVSVQEAIEAYTINSAYASFDEGIKGSITPGKLADLVVLSQDILSVHPNEIINTEVLMTIVDGTVVFEK